MAIEHLAVDTNSLRQSNKEIEEGISVMRSKLKELVDKMTELDAMYDGPASEVFRASFTADCDTFNEMLEILQEFSGDIDYAANEYDSCEDKVHGIVKAIRL